MVAGGNPPQRPDQLLQPLSRAGSGPAPQSQEFLGRLAVIFGSGANTGLFVYNGQPALGNPPIFALTTASTDPYGNPVVPNTIDAPTLAALLGQVQTQTETVNPGPLLLYGSANQSIFVFTSTGTFTPTANGTVQVAFYGPGGTGFTATGGPGGGGGETVQDSDTVTNGTPYTITVGASSGGTTTATFNTKTISAHSGSNAAAGVGGAGGTGSTNAIHFNGGNGGGPSGPGFFGGGGGGGAGPGSAGSPGSANGNGGGGGAPAVLFSGGGNGGHGATSGAGAGQAGVAPGGGGGGGGIGGGAGARGLAVILFTATGGSTALLASMAQSAGTDPATGSAYQTGITTYNPTFGSSVSMQGGNLNLETVSQNVGFQASSALGNATCTDAAGLAGQVPINPATDYTSFTVTAAAFTQLTKAWSIPANDAGVGAHYRVTARGTGTQGTTAQTLTFANSFGGTNVAGVSVSTATLPISDTFAWKLEINAYCVTTGAGATWWLSTEVSLRNNTVGTDVFAAANIPTTTNTQASNAAIAFEGVAAWGATTGAPTITCVLSHFERVS